MQILNSINRASSPMRTVTDSVFQKSQGLKTLVDCHLQIQRSKLRHQAPELYPILSTSIKSQSVALPSLIPGGGPYLGSSPHRLCSAPLGSGSTQGRTFSGTGKPAGGMAVEEFGLGRGQKKGGRLRDPGQNLLPTLQPFPDLGSPDPGETTVP